MRAGTCRCRGFTVQLGMCVLACHDKVAKCWEFVFVAVVLFVERNVLFHHQHNKCYVMLLYFSPTGSLLAEAHKNALLFLLFILSLCVPTHTWLYAPLFRLLTKYIDTLPLLNPRFIHKWHFSGQATLIHICTLLCTETTHLRDTRARIPSGVVASSSTINASWLTS